MRVQEEAYALLIKDVGLYYKIINQFPIEDKKL